MRYISSSAYSRWSGRPSGLAALAACAVGVALWLSTQSVHGQAKQEGAWVNLGLAEDNIQAIGLSRTDPNLIYAGTNEGRRGIFKTTDGGKTWLPINNGLGELDFRDIVVDYKGTTATTGFLPDQIIYASSKFTRHIWKSTDGGLSWRNRLTGSTCGNSQMVMDPAEPTRIFISNCDGVRRTTDAAESTPWPVVGPASVADPKIAVSRTKPWIMYFAKGTTVYKTDNYGATTAALPALVGPEEQVGLRYAINQIVVDSTNDNAVYVGTASMGVYKSGDGGQTWFALNNTLPHQGQGFSVTLMAGDPVDGKTLYLYGGTVGDVVVEQITQVEAGFFKTTDGGVTWQAFNANIPEDLQINALVVPETGNREPMLATFEGIWRFSPVEASGAAFIRSAAEPAGSATIYRMDGGRRRPYPSIAMFSSCGFKTDDVKPLPAWYFARIEAGPAITSCAEAADFATAGGRYYTQAGPGGGRGYAVVDDAAANLYAAYLAFGGPAGLGFPISRRFQDGPFVLQAFQRGVLQWNPGTRSASPLNVLDELSARGYDGWLRSNKEIPPPADWSGDAKLPYPKVLEGHLALLDRNPAIRARYFASLYWLQDFGLPMAYAQSGGANVLRAQRAAFVERGGTVAVLGGGDLAKEAGFVPPQAREAD